MSEIRASRRQMRFRPRTHTERGKRESTPIFELASNDEREESVEPGTGSFGLEDRRHQAELVSVCSHIGRQIPDTDCTEFKRNANSDLHDNRFPRDTRNGAVCAVRKFILVPSPIDGIWKPCGCERSGQMFQLRGAKSYNSAAALKTAQ